MRKTLIFIAILAMGLFLAGEGMAHTPLCSCYDNGDGSVTCEGGFSDGSSAAGVAMRIKDKSGKALLTGKMNKNSEFTFKKPAGPYTVVFDGGGGHVIEIDGKKIIK